MVQNVRFTRTHTHLQRNGKMKTHKRWLNFIMSWQDIPITYWGYILSVLCSEKKSFAFFFSRKCEVSKAGPCWAANRQSWQRHEFFSSFRPPFLSLSLFSCRFSRYAAWTRSPGCMRTSRAASPDFHQLRELVPEYQIESRCVNTILVSVSLLPQKWLSVAADVINLEISYMFTSLPPLGTHTICQFVSVVHIN